jgi:hypothetical protein
LDGPRASIFDKPSVPFRRGMDTITRGDRLVRYIFRTHLERVSGSGRMPNDVETLTALNHDYVMSVRDADTKRFDEILAPDFLCTNPDASLLNRAQFIDLIGKGARITGLREDQVNVRIIGADFASTHARIQYKSKAGVDRVGRYTDDWARRDGKWLCVSAHTAGEDF